MTMLLKTGIKRPGDSVNVDALINFGEIITVTDASTLAFRMIDGGQIESQMSFSEVDDIINLVAINTGGLNNEYANAAMVTAVYPRESGGSVASRVLFKDGSEIQSDIAIATLIDSFNHVDGSTL